MEHIKTIKDDRGAFNIKVSLWVGNRWDTGEKFRYDIYVEFIPKGKRKAIYVNNIEMVRNIDILRAKSELWEMLKPKVE